MKVYKIGSQRSGALCKICCSLPFNPMLSKKTYLCPSVCISSCRLPQGDKQMDGRTDQPQFNGRYWIEWIQLQNWDKTQSSSGLSIIFERHNACIGTGCYLLSVFISPPNIFQTNETWCLWRPGAVVPSNHLCLNELRNVWKEARNQARYRLVFIGKVTPENVSLSFSFSRQHWANTLQSSLHSP